MAVAAAPAPARRGRAAPPGWALVGVVVAVLVAGPLLVLPASFLTDPGAFGDVAGDLLPEALRNSVVLALGVGAGTLALGGSLAARVCF